MFEHLKEGDTVTRNMAGIMMTMRVRSVENGIITCDALQENGELFLGGWTFNAVNGWEEDHEIQWGTQFGRTGSYLMLEG